ncbi:MAG: hypothetical protein AAF585_28375, partial [Verrucomicrobiota bacterium]
MRRLASVSAAAVAMDSRNGKPRVTPAPRRKLRLEEFVIAVQIRRLNPDSQLAKRAVVGKGPDMPQEVIKILGARQHNLKNIDVEIPRNQLVVITGVSGSGKSSLAFNTLYAEGQRRYVESLSAYARQFLDQLEKPDVDFIEGLSPAIAIEQRSSSPNPRSTIATTTEIYDYLRILYAAVGVP